MRSLKKVFYSTLGGTTAVALAVSAAVSAQTSTMPKLGEPVTEELLANWDIDVRTPDSLGLPEGSGSVADGKIVYDASCASCHGADAEGGPVFGAMVGGIGSFTTDKRTLTPGSMYPYPGVLFDYIKRAMPMTAPQSLTDDEVYAVSAYLLNLNGLIADDAVMDAESMAGVEMPNKDGFIVDDRPDVSAIRCMKDCKPINGSS